MHVGHASVETTEALERAADCHVQCTADCQRRPVETDVRSDQLLPATERTDCKCIMLLYDDYINVCWLVDFLLQAESEASLLQK